MFESIHLSTLFVIIILSIVLVGILIIRLYRYRTRKVWYLIAISVGIVIHMAFDVVNSLNPTPFVLKVDIFVDLSFIFFSLLFIYLLKGELDKFWKYTFTFLIAIGISLDIIEELFFQGLLFEFLHFVFMFGIFVSFYFLTIKFLIDVSRKPDRKKT